MPDIVLICIAADAPLTVAGSSFNRVCSECSTRVMVAPSGRRMLAAHPAATILCTDCFAKRHGIQPDDVAELAAQPEELSAEMKAAIPNPYRSRN